MLAGVKFHYFLQFSQDSPVLFFTNGSLLILETSSANLNKLSCFFQLKYKQILFTRLPNRLVYFSTFIFKDCVHTLIHTFCPKKFMYIPTNFKVS